MTERRIRAAYLVCAEPRSGSTFLEDMLTSTGVLGRPVEYFASIKSRADMLRDPEAGLAALIERVTTPNGVFALKLFSYQFDVTAKARWVDRLPNLRFVHLERRDLLGQAISNARALQTGRYWSTERELAPPRYDGRAIARQLRRIAGDQARWHQYFARNAIQPLRLTYEEVVADPQGTAARIAELIGEKGAPKIDLSQIRRGVTRDAISDEWRRRFVDERADRNALVADGFAGRGRQWLRRVRHMVASGATSRDDRR